MWLLMQVDFQLLEISLVFLGSFCWISANVWVLACWSVSVQCEEWVFRLAVYSLLRYFSHNEVYQRQKQREITNARKESSSNAWTRKYHARIYSFQSDGFHATILKTFRREIIIPLPLSLNGTLDAATLVHSHKSWLFLLVGWEDPFDDVKCSFQ